MKTLYTGIDPNGGAIESFNINDIPGDWEIIETQIEDSNIINAELEIEALRQETKEEISKYVRRYTEDNIFDGIPIPEEVKENRELMKLDYRQKKEAIYQKYGITP